MDETSVTRRIGRHVMAGALAAASTIVATEAAAALDIFLKVETIKGESQDAKHPGEIDVLSWSWGVVGPTSQPRQPACATPLRVLKNVDAATPQLVASAALNTTLPSATLTVVKTGAEPFEFLVITLHGVQVTSVQDGASTAGSTASEQLALGFASATVQYTPQKPDGSAGTPITSNVPASCPPG